MRRWRFIVTLRDPPFIPTSCLPGHRFVDPENLAKRDRFSRQHHFSRQHCADISKTRLINQHLHAIIDTWTTAGRINVQFSERVNPGQLPKPHNGQSRLLSLAH